MAATKIHMPKVENSLNRKRVRKLVHKRARMTKRRTGIKRTKLRSNATLKGRYWSGDKMKPSLGQVFRKNVDAGQNVRPPKQVKTQLSWTMLQSEHPS